MRLFSDDYQRINYLIDTYCPYSLFYCILVDLAGQKSILKIFLHYLRRLNMLEAIFYYYFWNYIRNSLK